MMRDLITLVEGLSDWSGQEWVHYSKEPYLKINGAPYHQDPLGLYFFPEAFVPTGMWRGFPYKFTVRLKPGARILDLAHTTMQQVDAIVDAAGVREKYDAYMTRWPPEDMRKRVDSLWEILRAHYAYELQGTRALAKFNKLFRDLGFDAIFDDIYAIHSAEVQLLVLDPRFIDIVGVTQRRGSGYAEMIKVRDDLVRLCQEYGEVTATEPRKARAIYSTEVKLQCTVDVRRSERNYADFVIMAEKRDGQLDQIDVALRYSRPILSSGNSLSYSVLDHTYSDDRGLQKLRYSLDKVFAQDDKDNAA